MTEQITTGTERDARTYAIIGAAMEVHRILGSGFLEPVYQEALAVELELREIPFNKEQKLAIQYKGRFLECAYKPDFICYAAVILELMALGQLTTVEHAQVINYLKATGIPIGLLVNFGTPKLEFKRFILTHSSQ